MVNDVAKNIPIINVALEDRKVDHRSTMLEVEGKILNTSISVLIDSRASLSYIAPRVLEKCKLSKEKKKNEWLVQLVTRMKIKVTKLDKYCKINFSGMSTTVNLNILSLGSYDILIGMEWLESHREIINCLHKSLDCMDEEGNRHTVKGIYRPITTQQIFVVQLKKCLRKGC